MKYIKYGWEELEVLENASVPITKQDTTDVLFGFAHLNAGCDMKGNYGGFSFRLYRSGLIIVQEYLFGEILAEERRYCVPQTCTDEIKQYYSENQDTLFSLFAPDNGSCDGSFSEFFFGNEWISALNIDYHTEKDFIRAHKAYQGTQNYRANFRANVARELEKNPQAVNDQSFQIAMKMAQSFEDNQESFEEIKRIMLEENKIMTVFFSICDILKKYDIILEQFRVTVKGVSTTTYSDFMKSFHKEHRK
ncbi:MAG: hypothetical protein K5979_12780 [Ruminococcus sp.]|nr:hypothetical protein [Ruminococcus sp.]